jgi:integrase/recombinase XerD
MTSVNDILFGFREHLKVLNRSAATLKSYTENAKFFLDAAGCDVRAITRKTIENYIATLHEHRTSEGKPYSAGTISVKVRSIKRFFEYLEKANIVFINPAEFIREPKKVRGIPRNILTPAEARAILDQPNLGTLAGIRDRAILELFYSTGIRLEELCSLTIYDADLQGGLVRINNGKGKKDRVVPMGKHAVKFLKEYVTKVRPNLTRKNRTERRLFIDRTGKPLSKKMVSLNIKACSRAANIGKHVTAHTFRHTFASSLIKNGADIVAVQKMLGHAVLKATEVYLRALGIDLKAAHKKSHPREKEREENASAKPALERIMPHDEHRAKPGRDKH